MNLGAYKKSIINVLTVIVTSTPLILQVLGEIHLDPSLLTTVTGLLGLAGVALHALVPNTTTDPEVAAKSSVKLVSPAS